MSPEDRQRPQPREDLYPGVLHIDSLAKYAAAFFKMSRSIRNVAFSCRNLDSSASASPIGARVPLVSVLPARALPFHRRVSGRGG